MSDDKPVIAERSDGVEARRETNALETGGFVLPRRRVWPLFVVVALLLAGGGWLAWSSFTKPLPTRVLIAVDIDGQWWNGSEPAARLADRLGKRLEELGFDVVRAGAPETLKALEAADTPMAAAKSLRASFVVSGSATPTLVELPVEGGFFEGRLSGELRVSHVDEADGGSVHPLHGYVGAKERDAARSLLVTQVMRLAMNAVPPALVKHPSVEAILRGNDARLVDRLNPARQFVEAYDREMARAKAAYVDLDQQRRAAEKSGREVHFISTPDAEDRLVATGPGGVLLSTANVIPFYRPSDGGLLRQELLETVEWRSEAGERRVLWEGYNLFTYPTAAATGETVLVEDLFGWARTLAVVAPELPLKRLRVSPTRKFSEPKLSPAGSWVAYVDKRCRTCTREIAVMDRRSGEQGEQLRLAAPAYARLGGFAWLDDKRVMVLANATDADQDEGYGLWAFDAASGTRTSLMVGRGAQLAWPAASRDGRRAAVAHLNGNAIVVLNIADKSVRNHRVDGQPSALAFSPDGTWIAFELRDKRYRDIAALEVATGKVVRLTNNDSPDRFPLFSEDGQRVYFEARNTDPLFGRKRAVVRVAWVALSAP